MVFLGYFLYYRDYYLLTSIEYLILIAELTLNYMNQKNIWNQILVQSCIPIREKHQHIKPCKVAEDTLIILQDTKGVRWWLYCINTKVSL